MPELFGLGPPPPLLTGSGHLNIVMRGFATERHCYFGVGKHGTRKGHALKSGTAYFIETPDGIQQVGPTCAEKLGKQKLHTVPDLTRWAISPEKDEEEIGIKSGCLVKPPGRFDAKRFEEEERAKDIEYMLLRWQLLPAVAAVERLRKNPRTINRDVRPPAIASLFDEYKSDRYGTQLGEIRRIRDHAEQGDLKNSFARLHILYIAYTGIDKALKSRSVVSDEIHFLYECKNALIKERALDFKFELSLIALIKDIVPGMPTWLPGSLTDINQQQMMFDGLDRKIEDRSKLPMLSKHPKRSLPPEERVFG